jgi:hypothetical protein
MQEVVVRGCSILADLTVSVYHPTLLTLSRLIAVLEVFGGICVGGALSVGNCRVSWLIAEIRVKIIVRGPSQALDTSEVVCSAVVAFPSLALLEQILT